MSCRATAFRFVIAHVRNKTLMYGKFEGGPPSKTPALRIGESVETVHQEPLPFKLERLLQDMERLTQGSEPVFKAVRLRWRELKSQAPLRFFQEPGWKNYRKVRDFWRRKTPSAKKSRAEKDLKRRQDPTWKAEHAARMRASRARRKKFYDDLLDTASRA